MTEDWHHRQVGARRQEEDKNDIKNAKKKKKKLLLETCPLLVPKDKSFCNYHGYLLLNNNNNKLKEIVCEISFKKQEEENNQNNKNNQMINYNNQNNNKWIMNFKTNSLQELLQTNQQQFNKINSFENILINKLKKQTEPIDALIELKNTLDIMSINSNNNYSSTSTTIVNNNNIYRSGTFYKNFLQQLDEIGWDKIIDLKVDFSYVTLCIKDKHNREHFIEVNTCTLETKVDLPITLENLVDNSFNANFNTNQEKKDLKKILEQYEQLIEQLNDFFEVMEDIDQHIKIIEPERPTRCHTMRRMIIKNHCSLQIEIDPFRPKEKLKDFKFFGADQMVAPLRLKLNQQKQNNGWDNTKFVRENLENILGIKWNYNNKACSSGGDSGSLKTREEEEEDYNEDCGICYSYRMNLKVPDKICDNEKCSKCYHTECLIEWLRNIPGSHQSFDTIFGSCPYCSSPISVSINVIK
ncbi:hypothetical protein ABK040_006143 [Willaertia magna]